MVALENEVADAAATGVAGKVPIGVADKSAACNSDGSASPMTADSRVTLFRGSRELLAAFSLF